MMIMYLVGVATIVFLRFWTRVIELSISGEMYDSKHLAFDLLNIALVPLLIIPIRMILLAWH